MALLDTFYSHPSKRGGCTEACGSLKTIQVSCSLKLQSPRRWQSTHTQTRAPHDTNTFPSSSSFSWPEDPVLWIFLHLCRSLFLCLALSRQNKLLHSSPVCVSWRGTVALSREALALPRRLSCGSDYSWVYPFLAPALLLAASCPRPLPPSLCPGLVTAPSSSHTAKCFYNVNVTGPPSAKNFFVASYNATKQIPDTFEEAVSGLGDLAESHLPRLTFTSSSDPSPVQRGADYLSSL